MTAATTLPAPSSRAHREPVEVTGTAVLDVVVPVFNEERDLGPCVRRLHRHLTDALPYPFRITVADNASTDATLAVAAALADEFAEVTVVHLDEKGRGRALRAVWSASDAPVLAYMDVDLSTDLNALLPLVAPLISGHSDLAIGSRLAPSSRVVRGVKREVISRCYNVLLRGTLRARFSDAQCGFKAIRADVARRLLPLVEDTGLVLRHRAPGARRALGAADPRGARRLGRRPGLAGRRACPPRSPTSRASPASAARWPRARCRSRSCAGSSGAPRSARPTRGRGWRPG